VSSGFASCSRDQRVEQKNKNAPEGEVQDGADPEAVRSQIKSVASRKERLSPEGGAFSQAAYRYFHAKKMGTKSTATTGRLRVADSSGRRIMMPQFRR